MSDSPELIFEGELIIQANQNIPKYGVLKFSSGKPFVTIWEKRDEFWYEGKKPRLFYRSPTKNHQISSQNDYDPNLVYLGSLISINYQNWKLTEVSESTLKFMEQNPDKYPFSNIHLILANLKEKFSKKDLLKKFSEIDVNGTGLISIKESNSILSQFELNPHQVRTIQRKFSISDSFHYENFLSTF